MILQIVILIILIILIIIIWKYLLKDFNFNKENDLEKQYEKLDGGEPNNKTKNLLEKFNKKQNKTSKDFYRIGNIHKHILHDQIKADENYARALQKLEEEKAQNRLPTRNHTMHMINNIWDNFAVIRPRSLTTELHVINPETDLIPNWNFAEDMDDNFVQLQRNLLGYYSQTNNKSYENGTATKAQVVERYMNEGRKVVNDPQNVHDSNVGKDLKTTFDKLEHTQLTDRDEQEIIQSIQSKNIPQEQKDKAINTLNKMAVGDEIVRINSNENEVLGSVWHRIKDPRNITNRNELENSLIGALAEGSGTCITGRCSRVITSLSFLDDDPTIGKVVSTDMVKNEAINRASIILKEELEKTTPEIQIAYNIVKPTQQQQQLNDAFTAEVKQKIKNDILKTNNDVYKLDIPKITQIIAEATAF
jgi:hypothetical protein